MATMTEPPSFVPRTPDARVGGLLDRDYLGFTQSAGTAQRWLDTPVPSVTVILNVGAPFGGYPRSFVTGLADRGGVVDQVGAIECVELKLTPLGAYRLLGVPMADLANQIVDLDDILDAHGLAGRLAETPGWDRRFDLVDRFLLDRADRGPVPAGEVSWAWRRLLDTQGAIPIGALADEVGWSRRHLVTRFRQQVGLPPKTVARIVRFRHLLDRLTAHGPVAWPRLAVECGYYDQAHMNRDFREFAGITPTEYLARLTPVALEVTSVQFTWVPAA
jgi:AraC-like DNA-binding protein